MRSLFGLLAVAVVAPAAVPQPQPQPPPPKPVITLKADKEKYLPCRMLKVSADGGGKNVLWRVDGEVNDAEPDGKVFRCVPKASARPLTVRAYTAINDEVIEAVLVVQPADAPPEPPKPDPLPPNDPLAAEVRDLVPAAERPLLKDLAALYTLMVEECPKADYTTAADLNDVYKDAAQRLVKDRLMPARRRLATEVAAVAGTDPDAPLTPDLRKKLETTYARLAKVCEAASK